MCVAIFLFLSGYGLTKSFSKYYFHNSINSRLPLKKNCRYVFNHLIKLLSDYWFVYLIFVPIGLFFGRSFLSIYGNNPLHYLTDFFGVSYLFYEYEFTMNATWWFMSIIIVYYLLFPILYKILQYSPELLLLISLALLFNPFYSDSRQIMLWLSPFVFGMYIAKYNLFDKISRCVNTIPKRIIVTGLAIVLFAYLRLALFGNEVTIDFLFAFAIILFCFLVLSRIPILNKILEQLGKHSGAIFMFHTFIFDLYFKDFIYWFEYPPLIFIVLTVVCYLIAIGLECLKKITKYNSLADKVTNWILVIK